MRIKLLFGILLSALFALGQGILGSCYSSTCGSGAVVSCIGSSEIISSGTISGGMLCLDTDHAVRQSVGSLKETRKLTARAVTIAEVRASARRVLASSLASPNYWKLATSIGLNSAAVDEAKVLNLISRKDYRVYDYDSVDNYLYHQALKHGTDVRWVWEPLRDVDLEAGRPYASWNIRAGMGLIYPKVYQLAVPERALAKVAEILEDGEVSDVVFFISHYEVSKPDPFLAISTPKLLEQGKIYVIDQWDEPGFVEGPAKPVAPIATQSAIAGE